MALRPLPLPAGVPGRVYLTRMPGLTLATGDPVDYPTARDAIVAAGVDTVLCLTPLQEIEERSPRYAEAIKANRIPWTQWMLPMPDYGSASDRDAWLARICEAAEHLKRGGKIAVHCAAGIGRTGTVAVCVLMALGMRRADAWAAVLASGSQPEAEKQIALIDWAAKVLEQGDP